MHQLIVALDVPGAAAALQLSRALAGVAGGVKVGLELFTAEGPGVVARLQEDGTRVFLDLKFHDIPNTVAGAVRSATRLGVWMLNVHAAGGAAMLRAAVDAAGDTSARVGLPPPMVIAVTALTSLDAEALREVGVGDAVEDHVLRLADLACRCGLDGVVASPREVRPLRARFGADFVLVTPGIRDADSQARAPADDQVRTMSAAAALAAGSSYIVVGRPITSAASPRDVAIALAASL
jgi:orotidine-5'-phosphate decarboxylase